MEPPEAPPPTESEEGAGREDSGTVAVDLPQLFMECYDELHRLARSLTWREPPWQAPETDALLDEAFLRLARAPGRMPRSPTEFVSYVGRVMRNTLVDRARSHARRRVRASPVPLDALAVAHEERRAALRDMGAALSQHLSVFRALGPRSNRAATVFELRYVFGFTTDEVAAAMGLSARTVRSDFQVARAWLRLKLVRDVAT